MTRPMRKPRKSAAKSGVGVSQVTLAKYLDISQQRVAQFVAEGVFPRLPDGKLDKDVSRVIYIRWLRDETRKSSTSEAARRVQDARARGIEIRNARELGKLVPTEDVLAWNAEILGTLRTELSGVAAASTRDLELRVEIEKQVNAAVERAKRSFDVQADALLRGEHEPSASDDAE
jgi:hypothetical protein